VARFIYCSTVTTKIEVNPDRIGYLLETRIKVDSFLIKNFFFVNLNSFVIFDVVVVKRFLSLWKCFNHY